MKNIFYTITKYAIWALIFAGASYAYAVGTWSEPGCDPVECNVDAPINTSSSSQTKAGYLWTGGFGSTAGGYFATVLGVGVSSSTDPNALGLVGLFGGKVGATEYCDEEGDSCTDASELGGNSNNIVLFTNPTEMRSTRKENQACFVASSQSTSAVTQSWTLSELQSIFPTLASETRTIKGILVSYSTALTNSVTTNYDKGISIIHSTDWTSEGISGPTTEGDAGYFLYRYGDINNVLMHTTNTIIIAGDLHILDVNGNGTFNTRSQAQLTNGSATGGSLCFSNDFYVVGYITE